MDFLFNIFNKVATSTSITDAGLSVLIISVLGALYKFVFAPAKEKIDKMPSTEQLKDVLNEFEVEEKINVEELSKKLDKIVEVLERIEDYEKSESLKTEDIKRDIESVKTILNQFQGHLMYGGRSGDFGNRELR